MKADRQFFILALIHFIYFLIGVNVVTTNKQNVSSFILGIIAAILITFWCMNDAKSKKYHLSHAFQFIIFILPPIGWPLYLLSSRGLLGGMKFIGLQSLLWILITVIPASLLKVALHGGAMVR